MDNTTTELVLTLIEDKLLRAEPAARSNLEELCGKLQDLSEFAERKIQSLEKFSRDVDPVLMAALSSIEEEAQIQRSTGSKLNLSQQSWYQLNPRAQLSMRMNKEEMIQNQSFGQTAHRKQILEEKLKDFYDKQVNNGPQTVQAVHNSAVTQSLVD
ncbi:hypothetical protein J4E83_008716 [Alternaria metachromatica]|uniref:uncharacterized protein n=1 Tax=Alternaria metachromatica TaxID=283354 RepID=UPI0020C20B54|nr:uncharacterized protein J4E83_008716 [Alternaria metachromatica]KAI4609546.1 hypothetical protein J4E83_008716 [Alternaria metachromatica]